MNENLRYHFFITWREQRGNVESFQTFTYTEMEDLEFYDALENALLEGGFSGIDEALEIEQLRVIRTPFTDEEIKEYEKYA